MGPRQFLLQGFMSKASINFTENYLRAEREFEFDVVFEGGFALLGGATQKANAKALLVTADYRVRRHFLGHADAQ